MPELNNSFFSPKPETVTLMLMSLVCAIAVMRFFRQLKVFVHISKETRRNKNSTQKNTDTQRDEAEKGRAVCSMCFAFIRFGIWLALCRSLACCFLPSLPSLPRRRCVFFSLCFIFFRIIIWMATNTIKTTLIFSVNIFGGKQKNIPVSFLVCVCVCVLCLCPFRWVDSNFSIYPAATLSLFSPSHSLLNDATGFRIFPLNMNYKINAINLLCVVGTRFSNTFSRIHLSQNRIHTHTQAYGLRFVSPFHKRGAFDGKYSLWHVYEWVTLRMPDKGAHNERFKLIE